jgi:serine/threonine-protein kinase
MNENDLTGGRLGGYRILRKLGQGGMATVYKAHEESLNRVVALKVIGRHLTDKPEFVQRFKREAQAAAQLSHPNIVQIHAIGEDDGVHYFSMEYVRGQSLADLIEADGFLTAGRAVPILRQAAQALAVAHDAGIVHRDIKPANVMLDEAGRVKVADFGIAQMVAETRLTQSGMMIGTPEYISPEQCRGEKLDGRSDIYSLGVTFFQMLSGQTPYETASPTALVLQIVEGRMLHIGELNPTIPAGVQAIVKRMLATDRAERFQGAEDLLAALEGVDVQPVTKSVRKPAAVPGLPPVQGATPQTYDPTEVISQGPDLTEVLPPVPGAVGAPAELSRVTPDRVKPVDPTPSEPSPPPPPSVQSGGRTPGRSRSLRTAAIAAAMVGVILAVALLWPRADDSPNQSARVAALGAPGADTVLRAPSARQETTPGSEGGGSPPERADEPKPVVVDEEDAQHAARLMSPRLQAPGGGDSATVDPRVSRTVQPTFAQAEPASRPPASSAAASTSDSATADPQASRTVQPAFAQEAPVAAPSANSLVAVTSGDYEYVDLVHTWVVAELMEQDFDVVNLASPQNGSIQDAARFQVITTVRLLDSSPLEFFGTFETQYTAALTVQVSDLESGTNVMAPASSTVKYTAVNLQRNLEKAARDLARRVARELRQVLG